MKNNCDKIEIMILPWKKSGYDIFALLPSPSVNADLAFTLLNADLAFTLLFFSSFILIILPPIFWPLTTSACFVLLKQFSYQNVQYFKDIPAISFGFYTFFTFWNIQLFPQNFAPFKYIEKSSNPLPTHPSLNSYCFHIVSATDFIQTLNKTVDFELFFYNRFSCTSLLAGHAPPRAPLTAMLFSVWHSYLRLSGVLFLKLTYLSHFNVYPHKQRMYFFSATSWCSKSPCFTETRHSFSRRLLCGKGNFSLFSVLDSVLMQWQLKTYSPIPYVLKR